MKETNKYLPDSSYMTNLSRIRPNQKLNPWKISSCRKRKKFKNYNMLQKRKTERLIKIRIKRQILKIEDINASQLDAAKKGGQMILRGKEIPEQIVHKKENDMKKKGSAKKESQSLWENSPVQIETWRPLFKTIEPSFTSHFLQVYSLHPCVPWEESKEMLSLLKNWQNLFLHHRLCGNSCIQESSTKDDIAGILLQVLLSCRKWHLVPMIVRFYTAHLETSWSPKSWWCRQQKPRSSSVWQKTRHWSKGAFESKRSKSGKILFVLQILYKKKSLWPVLLDIQG